MKLLLPGFTQPRLARLQILIVVPGMANKLPCAFGNAAGDRVKQCLIESTRYHDAERTVRCSEPFSIDRFAELAGESAENANFDITRPKARAGEQVVGPQGSRGPKGLRMARTPHSAAARKTGRRILGNKCVCLWVSMCETEMPAD